MYTTSPQNWTIKSFEVLRWMIFSEVFRTGKENPSPNPIVQFPRRLPSILQIQKMLLHPARTIGRNRPSLWHATVAGHLHHSRACRWHGPRRHIPRIIHLHWHGVRCEWNRSSPSTRGLGHTRLFCTCSKWNPIVLMSSRSQHLTRLLPQY